MVAKKNRLRSRLNMLQKLPLLLITMIHYTPNRANAQYFFGSVSEAMGRSGRAGAEVSESVFLNPASIPHGPSFTAGLFYNGGEDRLWDERTALGLSLVDNSEGVVLPGAFAYVQQRLEAPGGLLRDEKYYQVSFGNFVVPRWAWGFSVIRFEQDVANVDEYEFWNGVLGLHHTLNESFGVGLVYYHFPIAGDEAPEAFRLPEQLGLGVQYLLTETLRLRLDLDRPYTLNPKSRVNYSGGVEGFLHEFAAIRLGTENDEVHRLKYWTAGASFHGPKFKFDYSLRISDSRREGAMHGVDIRMPF